MNWESKPTEFVLENGHVDRIQEIKHLITTHGRLPLLVVSMGDTVYAAVKDTATQETAAWIYKITIEDDHFLYALMKETENPTEQNCPLSILKRLTPTKDENANRWRAACYASYKESKKKKTLNKLPLGAKIQFVNDRKSVTIGDHKAKMGDVIQLIKKRIGAKKEWEWFTGKVRWNLSIPNDFEVIK